MCDTLAFISSAVVAGCRFSVGVNAGLHQSDIRKWISGHTHKAEYRSSKKNDDRSCGMLRNKNRSPSLFSRFLFGRLLVVPAEAFSELVPTLTATFKSCMVVQDVGVTLCALGGDE